MVWETIYDAPNKRKAQRLAKKTREEDCRRVRVVKGAKYAGKQHWRVIESSKYLKGCR
jgi:hypothetical protein